MTPNEGTFKVAVTWPIGTQIWHRSNRERGGTVKGVTFFSRTHYEYWISWGEDACLSHETETTITDERPSFDGAGESGDN